MRRGNVTRLQQMSDDEILAKLKNTRILALQAIHEGWRDFRAEVDVCYFYRECEVRRLFRRSFHDDHQSPSSHQTARQVTCD